MQERRALRARVDSTGVPMVDDPVFDEVLAAFCTTPAISLATPVGTGNINDTFLVRSPSNTFVLQKINGEVFFDPLRVIENFSRISKHLRHKQDCVGQQMRVAAPVLTLERRLYFCDSRGDYWRGQQYLAHKSYSLLSSHEQAYQVGKILATFHGLIADLDLYGFLDPLPGFHNLPLYLAEYDKLEQGNKTIKEEQFRFCFTAIERFRNQATRLEEAKQTGILNLQPIHGDPKVENFLFDKDGQAQGLIDLDTVSLGLVHYDLGDCLRSCCNRQKEMEDQEVPNFDIHICQTFLEGYFSLPEQQLSLEQRGYIFDAVLLICFELGLRFFTDHLRGNKYFKVENDGDNLLRAVNQFRLTDDIARQEKKIRSMALSSGLHGR